MFEFEIEEELSKRPRLLESRLTLAISLLLGCLFLVTVWELGLLNSYIGTTTVVSTGNRNSKSIYRYQLDGQLKESRGTTDVRNKTEKEMHTWKLGVSTSIGNSFWNEVEDITKETLEFKNSGNVRLASLKCDSFMAVPFYKTGECSYRLELRYQTGDDFHSNSQLTGKLSFVSKGFLPRRIVRLQLSEFLIDRADSSMKSIEEESRKVKASSK